DQAVRVARGLNTLLFASASIPAYLLAVRVTAGRWLAAAAAVLGVAAPWLILTTALYTETFAFPVVIWTVWAMERAVRPPSPAGGNRLSVDVALAWLGEVAALSLGVGILPAIAAIAWYARALRSGRGTEWTFAFVTVVILALFAFATMYAQGGYLADRTEERY